MTKNVYVFSGLGASERIFQRLDFSGFSPTFIRWTRPLQNETIENYVARLLDQITTAKPILVGLSFGGLIAVEIAKQIDTEKVILIASAKTRNEIPFYYRIAGHIRLHKLLPAWVLKNTNFITNWLCGTTSAFDNQLLRSILADTDPTFLKWAIDKVLRWTNMTHPKNLTHIHGTDDRVLPIRFVKCDLTIKNGGHLMALNKAEELTPILRRYL